MLVLYILDGYAKALGMDRAGGYRKTGEHVFVRLEPKTKT